MRECSIYKKVRANQQSDETAEPFFLPWTHPFFSERTFKLCSMSMECIHADQNFQKTTKLKLVRFYKAAVLPWASSSPDSKRTIDQRSISDIAFFVDFRDLVLALASWLNILMRGCACKFFTMFSHKSMAKLIHNRQFDTSLCCMHAGIETNPAPR